MDIEIMPDATIKGLAELIDDGKQSIMVLWSMNANPDAVKSLKHVTICLEHTINVLKTCLKMLIEKDTFIRETVTERDRLADAYHDQTAVIDEQHRKIEELEAGLREYQRWYEEHQS